MTKKDNNRRKLLKSIAGGSGVVIAGKSLPESWSKPIVDAVMIPAHAETTDETSSNPTTTTAPTTTLATPTTLPPSLCSGCFPWVGTSYYLHYTQETGMVSLFTNSACEGNPDSVYYAVEANSEDEAAATWAAEHGACSGRMEQWTEITCAKVWRCATG